MSSQYSIAIATAGSKEEAEKLARALLDQGIAACIQVNQIKSYYRWKGNVNVDDEQILLIKCKHADFADIQKCIKENHSYEVPEIIEIPITAGSPDYLNWISEVTR